MSYKAFLSRERDIKGLVQEIIEVENMTYRNRTQNKVYQRYYLFNYLRENTTLSLTAIGKMFMKDHATVINGINRHTDFIEYNDKKYIQDVAGIKQYLDEEFEKHLLTNSTL